MPAALLPTIPVFRLFLLLLLAGLGWTLPTRPALAHASLVAASPADGAMLAQAPTGFALTFSEPTSPLVLSLVTPDGTRLPLDRFTLRDRTLEIDAPPALSQGTHVLSWRVISEDGHPVGGSVVFSIGSPSTTAPAAAEGPEPGVARMIWVLRVLLYAGLFAGIGGAFCLAWLSAPARAGATWIGAALLLAALSALASVGLQGVDALEAPLTGLGRAIVWKTGLATSFGQTVMGALLASILAGASLATTRHPARLLSLLSLLTLGVALAASGHAGAAPPQWATRPAVFLHGVGIALWVGALLPLALLFARRSPEAGLALRRFSLFIPLAVVPLLASGLLLAVIQLGAPAALWETAYGRVLTAKLILVAALLALAATNRRCLTEPALRGEPGSGRPLVRMIRLEIALVLAIFALAALWRFTPPPRALALAAAQPAQTHIHTLKAMADLTVTPGRAGPVDVSLMLMTGEFGPLDAKEVALSLANPALGIEPIRRKAERRDGLWRVDGMVIPAAGEWSVRIDILITDFDMTRLEGTLHIRS
ncbi:copper resistance CopC/CopD family protein [Ancylobacter terrae]|uniref:copper resistance CopC/CopD family protein n=1 Tax=Ancylobacter sp. sgz301288 TaxID=3342077 RepID=UPI00385C5113